MDFPFDNALLGTSAGYSRAEGPGKTPAPLRRCQIPLAGPSLPGVGLHLFANLLYYRIHLIFQHQLLFFQGFLLNLFFLA